MKRPCHAVAFAFTLALFAGQAGAQTEPMVGPLQSISPVPAVKALRAARAAGRIPSGTAAAGAAPALKVFPYTVTSGRDGQVYSGSIVGADPRNNGARTTVVPVVLIPLAIQFTGTSRRLDPTAPDIGCLGGNVPTALAQVQQSPLFNAVPNYMMNGVNMGQVTYADAFQRAQFWSGANGNPVVASRPAYHLGFNVTVAPLQTITLANDPTGMGATYAAPGDCSLNAATAANPPALAAVDVNQIDPLLTGIIAKLGLNPAQFALFVTYRMFLTDGPPLNLQGNCCILGYHNSTSAHPTPDQPGQTYGIAYYDPGFGVFGAGTKDISVLTHEVMEWVNDPSGNNLTPYWGGIGQVAACTTATDGQNNLEVGDPLSGKLMPGVLMPNGITYHAQEQAFFSWFLDAGFTGAGGKFSSNGTFAGYAKNCPGGGTY